MGTHDTNSPALEAGHQLDRYRVLGLLAEGGMAEVYLARDGQRPGLGGVVVLKRVRPHLLRDPRFETMFANEAHLVSMIRHPNVVEVYELLRVGPERALVMEFLHGKNLLAVGKTCDTGGFWVPYTLLARVVAETARGLHHAHRVRDEDGKLLKLVHRDMSPENVIVCYDGRVKVVDFGVAKATLTPDTTQHGVVKGKLNYLAPEAIQGRMLDARADIYALGVTLYLFLTARFPYTAASTDKLIDAMFKTTPPIPSSINHNIPAALDRICMRCLERDRESRYRDAAELATALETYIESTGAPAEARHVAAFMNQLYPCESDELRAWVETISDMHPTADPITPPETSPRPASSAAASMVPQMQHGGTLEMPASERPGHPMATGFTSPDLWAEVTDIHARATTIVHELQASGVHVALRNDFEGSIEEATLPGAHRPRPARVRRAQSSPHEVLAGPVVATRVARSRLPMLAMVALVVAVLGGALGLAAWLLRTNPATASGEAGVSQPRDAARPAARPQGPAIKAKATHRKKKRKKRKKRRRGKKRPHRGKKTH